ncbi:phosphoenolpyruvate--protein phosphotransferase [Usitatibacter palustris]|uniref:phosphoenolpyruvate--protein phosphotransferase n=1 Tax=Usitatibacter palustris TaxID=2732487 RepID=A0A6M4HB00_9PROT|nr:phosphoenolpyruvate--protein phosphotransferase [Usitatibacter palustris]QJR16741.1 hypothetical protein DSM104440_03577 [Usitatibacter palustris]
MAKLTLVSPLAGWCLPLEEVPDPVFAEKMAGDGVAIDPIEGVLRAPCDGEIVPLKDAKHALTVRATGGIDILVHVGIDTVEMHGEGFEALVKGGDYVRAGDALLRFDLDLVARRAKSTVTPILLASPGNVVRRVSGRSLVAGDFLMEIEAAETVESTNRGEEHVHRFSVPFDHGFHARPAALVAAALRPLRADVAILARGRSGNARSTVALMGLGIRYGETIDVRATGPDAARAIKALANLLAPVAEVPVVSRDPIDAVPRRVKGVIASRGFAVGIAVQLERPEAPVVENGEGEVQEEAHLAAAVQRVTTHLEQLHASAKGEQKAILAAHVELAQDPDLAAHAHLWLRRGKSAAHAWRESTRSTIAALGALDDPRMRERVADLRDLEGQVLRVLAGESPGDSRVLPDKAIVLADELLPSQLLALDFARVAGICTASGGPTSHVAIIAAARGIPTLVAAGPAVLRIAEGTPLVVDAERGLLEVDPSPVELAEMQAAVAAQASQRAADLAAAITPCRTTDHVAVAVYANLGALKEAAPAIANGAEGCGLLRTEFLFLERHEPPGEDEQAREYQAIADALQGRPLAIRTLDIGGDKPIPYLPMPREDNPALGLRGLRTSLWKPELLRTQLRAILRVKPASACRILLPMVTDIEDLVTVRALLDECAKDLGIDATPALGVMIETPASAMLADQLAVHADFFSIGTNDLSQYTLAMDRGHPELAAKLDALHPAVLRLIDTISQAAHEAGREVAVCGGLASDPAAVPILVGLGIREISVVPAMIPRLKATIRTLDAQRCAELAERALTLGTATAVRQMMEAGR